ncbi:S1 family peptidase [Streptomyces sp. NPDC051098]|uniref:S1 family peptidase n=1 Tax=Streptomyces sp. NPDC051098 TaxID=3155411 RepID=UPI003413194C
MTHARRRLQRIARLAAVGGLLCGGLMVTDAVAGEAPGPGAGGTPAHDVGTRLVSELGTSRTAGTWMGDDGREVVAVTDEEAAEEVERAGARAKVVRYNMSQLRSATDALGRAPRVPGTAWSLDYATNTVSVQADSTVSAADWDRLSAVAEKIGASVRMERTAGSFTTRINGAEPILAGEGRCSAGFNVTDGRANFVLTAGHCGPAGTTWFQDNSGSKPVGNMTVSRFPGNDFALVQYQNGEIPGGPNVVNIGGGQAVRISGAAEAFVGQQVFRSGSTTGLRTGQVTGLNATVNYPEGTVVGLIKTTVCAEPGDSGGPLFAQGLALGVTSGGNGDCTRGGITYFQPATKAMAALGVRLTGGGAAADEAAQAPLNPDLPPPDTAGGNAPLAPGGGEGRTVTSILGPEAVAPGLIVITVSLLGLIATRSIWSAQDRRDFRSHYMQSWG